MAVKWKENKFKAGDDALDNDFPDYEVVEHRIGNQTNADANNNKFFSLEIHKCSNGKWRVYSNYGRVSEDEYSGVVGVYGPGTEADARAFFESKFKSKVRPSKGYKEIEFVTAKVGSPAARQKKHTIDDAEVPDSKRKQLDESKKKGKKSLKPLNLHHDISRLVKQWYDENSHAIQQNSAVTITSDGLETPLGVLTFGQINKGRSILTEISEAIEENDDAEVRRLTGAFYSNIPAKLGHKISDADLISTDQIVTQKADLLTMMEDALEVGGASFTSGVEQQYRDLGVDIVRLSKRDAEWQRVADKIRKTKGRNHYGTTTDVVNVFQTTLSADSKRYDGCDIGNEVELFHGSRNCNIMGIMNRGLLIAPPEAPVSGYMFDKGTYLADSSTKSINYSLYSFPGMGRSTNCFLFLVQARLGKIKKLQYSDYYASKYCLNGGKFDSVMGEKGPSLIHNEYIVYTLAQTKITHIVELKR